MNASGKSKVPTSAKWLGGLGLLPFLAATGLFVFGPASLAGPAMLALLAYATAILSFLGGARWGVEIARPMPRGLVLTASILPALAAWALLIGSTRLAVAWQLAGFILAFAAQGVWDTRAPNLPPWYAPLRLMLTVVVVAVLGLACWKAQTG
jgi:uncharacterized membrane protein